MVPKRISLTYEYFTLTSNLKYYVCQCIISKDGEERMYDDKISGLLVLLLKQDAPIHTSNLQIYLGRLHQRV